MPRTYRHWTPRYLWDRINEKLYRRAHPGLPWLTPEANNILAAWLKPQYVGAEFGSGGSTLWLARHLAHLTSVEHNPAWYQKVSAMLKDANLTNVDYYLKEKQSGDDVEGFSSNYVSIIGTFKEASLDFVLVDGIYRSACVLALLDKIKPGGLLVIDNANLHLPCHSHSPNSRTPQMGPASPAWGEFLTKVETWKTHWTSNGVSDTAFFYKPA
jgi:predicted O-methyltransferase YrrM